MTVTHSAPNTLVHEIPLDRIHQSTFNPRQNFDEEALDELATSIQQHGVIEPIIVRPYPVRENAVVREWGGLYEIIAGERRWRAAQRIALETIPALIRDVDDHTAIQIAITENLARKDLDPIEEARGYQLLADQLGMRQTAIAESVNRSQPAIANALRLLKLPEDVQVMIRDGRLTRAHGIELMRLEAFPAVQTALAELAVERNLTTKEVAKPFKGTLSYSLSSKGVVRDVWQYSAKFDISVCEQCPFNAYRKGDGGSINYCLNPAHFDELTAAAEAEEAAKIEAVAAEHGDVPSIKDFEHVVYLGGHQPASCTEDCPCRKQVIDRHGKLVTICTDGDRHASLRQAEWDEERRQREEARERALATTREVVDELSVEYPDWGADGITIGREELAVLAAAAFGWAEKCYGPSATEQALRHLETFAERHEREPFTVWNGSDPAEMHQIDPDLQVKVALEAVLGVGMLARTESPDAWNVERERLPGDFYLGTEGEASE